jgi:propanol-preferring alcohol dehydrogenase
MRAIRLHGMGEALSLEEVPLPEPDGDEVRVGVAGCGVCRTDLHIVDGTQPRVELPVTLGHEVAGWIDAAGRPAAALLRRRGLAIGDPVLVFGGWGCGECRECRSGAEQRCPRGASPGFQRDGGYAEAMLVPHPRHLVALGELDPVHAAPLADAGVTSYRAVRRAGRWLRTDARVALIGCGGLGQFALQHLRASPRGDGLRIAVSEREPRRLERADELGADVGVLDGDVSLLTEALVGPADVVIDLVGDDATLAVAAALVAPGGLVMLVGEAGGRLSVGFERPAVEAWFTTTAWGSLEDLRAVVGAAREGRLRWEVERLPLTDAATAHERVRRNEVDGRLVLVP